MEPNKKRVIGVIIFFLFAGNLFSQIAPNKYWVTFTDKDNNTFSLDSPEEFLTTKAIERRANQDIVIDITDLPVTDNYIEQLDAMTDVDILYASKWFNSVAIFSENPNIEEELLDLPFVGMVKSVQGQKGKDFNIDVKKEIELPRQKGVLDINYGLSFNQVDMLNGIPLHDAGFEGDGMMIGVVDAGFRLTDQLDAFDALFDEDRILATRDFVDGDINVYEPETSTHGMFVLSTIAGILPDSAYGTATQADFLLLRSEDSNSELRIEEHNWIAAAEFADSMGVDILTTSLGYTTFDEEEMDYTYEDLDGDTGVLTQAADIAASKGILVLNSAGNSGANDWHFIGVAADGDSVLAVGSVDPSGTHSTFSSFGPSSDGRIKPNVMAQGRQAVLCDFDNTPRTGNGTSFSCPIMAGMTACLWQMHPEASNMQIFYAVEESAHLFSTPNDSMGNGIPDFWEAHLILDEILGLDDSVMDRELQIYPNPSSDVINVELDDLIIGEYSIRIFSVSGSLVLNQKISNPNQTELIQLSINDLSPGSYTLSIRSEDRLYQQLFIKE